MTADAMILVNRMTTAEAQILVLIDNGILVDSEVNLLTTFVEGELTDKLNLILENPAISDTLFNTPYFNTLPDTTTIFNAIQSKIIQSSTFSTLIQSLLITGVGIGYIGTIAGTISKNISEADRLTGYINQFQANSSIHLDLDHKRDLTTQASNLLIHNIHSYSSNTSNLIFQNGFIHSNSITDILSPNQTLANFTTTQGLTSNELGSQRFINSNSITNILGMKENSLTFSTPLNRIGNTISIDLTNYVTENTLTIYAAAAAAASAAAAGASAVAAANYDTTAAAEAVAAGAGAGEATASAATATSAGITCVASAGTAVAAAVTATGSASSASDYSSTANSAASRACDFAINADNSAISATNSANSAANSASFCLNYTLSSNQLASQQFINSNSISNNFMSSNLLSKQNFINSNSITNIVLFYIPKISNSIPLYGTNPFFTFGTTLSDGMGKASTGGAFSSSALTGDLVIRSEATKNLILQHSSGAFAIKIDNANNTTISGTLTGTTVNATTLQQGGVGVSTLITNALSTYSTTTAIANLYLNSNQLASQQFINSNSIALNYLPIAGGGNVNINDNSYGSEG